MAVLFDARRSGVRSKHHLGYFGSSSAQLALALCE